MKFVVNDFFNGVGDRVRVTVSATFKMMYRLLKYAHQNVNNYHCCSFQYDRHTCWGTAADGLNVVMVVVESPLLMTSKWS